MIAAVILAAGASTRLGEPKQLVMLGSESLLERAVQTANEAGCAPVVVVLGAAYAEILALSQLGDAVPVINDVWEEGMASSIRLGIRTLGFIAKNTEGAVLMTCDQPAVTAGHVKALMLGKEVTASRYAGRNAVPAYFPKTYFSDLMALKGDAGARSLLALAASVELADGALDIDTIDDIARARKLFP